MYVLKPDLEVLVDPENQVDLQGVEVEQQADQLARETGFLRLKSYLNFFYEFNIVQLLFFKCICTGYRVRSCTPCIA